MSKLAIRLLTLALCTTALAVVPTVTPAQAATSGSGHIHKHKKHWRARVIEPGMSVRRGRLSRHTVRQARSARGSAGASIAGSFLLQSMWIPIEEFRSSDAPKAR
jgi:hypothetical protein